MTHVFILSLLEWQLSILVGSFFYLPSSLWKIKRNEYLTINDPLILWNNLRERYEHLKLQKLFLPKVHYKLMHLKLQIFKSVTYDHMKWQKYSSQKVHYELIYLKLKIFKGVIEYNPTVDASKVANFLKE